MEDMKELIRRLLECCVVEIISEVPHVDRHDVTRVEDKEPRFLLGLTSMHIDIQLRVVDDAAAREIIPGAYETMDRMITAVKES